MARASKILQRSEASRSLAQAVFQPQMEIVRRRKAINLGPPVAADGVKIVLWSISSRKHSKWSVCAIGFAAAMGSVELEVGGKLWRSRTKRYPLWAMLSRILAPFSLFYSTRRFILPSSSASLMITSYVLLVTIDQAGRALLTLAIRWTVCWRVLKWRFVLYDTAVLSLRSMKTGWRSCWRNSSALEFVRDFENWEGGVKRWGVGGVHRR